MAAQITIEQHVSESGRPELAQVFAGLAVATSAISRKIRSAGWSEMHGAAGAVNVQGEEQQKLDVFANDILMRALGAVPGVAALVSEEDEVPVLTVNAGATLVVIFDPLDGSSNIDVNVNVGTIFSIQQAGEAGIEQAILRPGSEQVGAGYVVYGPSTVMVITLGEGVAAFVLNDEDQFKRVSDAIRMPDQGQYYSTNEANSSSWPPVYRDYLTKLQGGELGGKAYSSRYVGSLVADFHRTLLKGGVFLYPPTDKAPRGKLRLLYEANPLAMIAEQAGGAAVDGPMRILELKPEQIHQRTPFVVGSKREVEALQNAVLGRA